MIKFKKIFYSPKKSSNNKYKNTSTSSLPKKRTVIKDKHNNISNEKNKGYDNDNNEKEMLKKRKNTINKINETLLFLDSKKFNEISVNNNKVNNAYSYSSIFVDKLKNNQKLKEKNTYLKNMIIQLKNYNNSNINIQNKKLVNSNKLKKINFYNDLIKENAQLNYINKMLKDEYSMLKLEENSNTNIKKILLNRSEIENKVKSLNYSLNYFLELISSNSNNSQTIENNSLRKKDNINCLNENNNVHTLFFETKGIKTNELNIMKKNRSEMQFIDEENLNINENNNHTLFLKKKIENGNINNINNATSEDFEIVIPLKRFEKTEYNKFRIGQNFDKNSPEMKNENKLLFSGKNKNANSFKSIECIKTKKNKQIKSSNNNKNKLPFKISNLINTSSMNKSVKLFHVKNNRTSSNLKKQNGISIKNIKKNDFKQYILNKNEIFDKKNKTNSKKYYY